MGELHIHAPRASDSSIRGMTCPVCGQWSRVMGFFVEWYGWDFTCLRCGDRWADGERLERPFRRGWRQESIERAKKHWRCYHPKADEGRKDD